MTAQSHPASPAAVAETKTRRGFPWRQFVQNKSALVGLIVITILVLTAVFAPWLTPKDPLQQSILNRYKEPQGWGGDHFLGTDELGRDLFSRIIMGARLSLQVGIIATGISGLFGVVLGGIAGYVGGRVDNFIMRIMDIILALPGILLAIAIVATLGPNIVNTMIAIAVVRIPAMARVIRSQVLSLKEEEFVQAARALGASHFTVLFKHVLRNAWAPALVLATLGMGTAIVTEASLSFLGLGAQPPAISWGRMLSIGREAIRVAPHVTLYPGLAIAVTVLGFNLLGDGLRDIFDPRVNKD